MEKMTEYKREFVPHPLTPAETPNNTLLGPKGETGFRKATEPQVNIFKEQHSSRVEPRQAHSSVMKSEFPQPSFTPGTESMLPFCSRSCRETGYTRSSMDPLGFAAEPQYPQRSLLPSSEIKSIAPNMTIIGKKESSGYLKNLPSNQTLPITPFEPSHFITLYKSTFCHPADSKKLEYDLTYANFINSKKGNTYTHQNMDRFFFRG